MNEMNPKGRLLLPFMLVGGLCLVTIFASPVLAQDEDEKQEPPTRESEEDPPSLDDLLGLEDDEDEDSAEDAAAQEADDELDRELREIDVADAFADALSKMTIAAGLLEEKFDPGLGTQRVQEEILAKLDILIDQAQQQSSSSSSSSSSSQQQQQSDPQQQQNNEQQQQQEQQQSEGERSPQGENRGEGDPPPRQDGVLGGVLDETRVEWGSLPDRQREQMQQGMNDERSALYRILTDEYYKRIAEEVSG